jgi:hypothetical protein
MEPTVTSVKFPYMRREVVDALQSLSDIGHQRASWVLRENQQPYDDLTAKLNILYDDTGVLPDPGSCVGPILFAEDVNPLLGLSAVLTPLLDRLGNRPDMEFLEDAEWSSVVAAARNAYQSLSERPA